MKTKRIVLGAVAAVVLLVALAVGLLAATRGPSAAERDCRVHAAQIAKDGVAIDAAAYVRGCVLLGH